MEIERTHPITSWCSRFFGCITCLGTLFPLVEVALQLSDEALEMLMDTAGGPDHRVPWTWDWKEEDVDHSL